MSTPYNRTRNRLKKPDRGGRILVKLKSGLTLAIPDTTPPEALKGRGYFILDGSPCAIPDLTITPAFFATCEQSSDVYELHQYEIVLGTAEDIA